MSNGNSPFTPTHVIVLSELHPREKEKYYDLLIQNDALFERRDDDTYISNVRVLAPGVKSSQETKKRSKDKNKSSSIEERLRKAEAATHLNTITVDVAQPFDYAAYPALINLISDEGDMVRPRRRPLAWVMKQIEELYDARYVYDTADLQDGEVDEETMAEKETVPFCVFLVKNFSTKMGLMSLIDQTGWDLLFNTHIYRKEHLEVEMFARFIQEFFNPDDILFFLYVRSLIQKLLNIQFRARWAKSDRAAKQEQSQPLWMSYREAYSIARTVFGNEDDPMCQEFLSMMENQLVGHKSKHQDTRRIQVAQFMHLAVVGYHETRPQEEDGEGFQDPNNPPQAGPQGSYDEHMGPNNVYGGISRGNSPGMGGSHQGGFENPYGYYGGDPNAQQQGQDPYAPQQDYYRGDQGYQQQNPYLASSNPNANDPGSMDDMIQRIANEKREIEEMERQMAAWDRGGPQPAMSSNLPSFGGNEGGGSSGRLGQFSQSFQQQQQQQQQQQHPQFQGEEGDPHLSPQMQSIMRDVEADYVNTLLDRVRNSLSAQHLRDIEIQISYELHRRVVGVLGTLPEVAASQNPEEIRSTLGYIISSESLQSEINPLFELCVEYVTNEMNGNGSG